MSELKKYFQDPNLALRKHFLKVFANLILIKKLSLISNISCKKTIQLVIALVVRRSYPRSIPPTFENKLKAINKDLEKLRG